MAGDKQPVQASEMKPALAPEFYSSPEIFALEAKNIFHSEWFCVGRLDQLPDKGDCLLVEVAGESVIVLRGRDEAVRAFYNVCRHRGSRLIRTNPLPDAADPAARNSSRVGTAIVCPYHAWTYNTRRHAARRALRAVRRGVSERGLLARAGRARDLGRLHLPEPVGQAAAARERRRKDRAHARPLPVRRHAPRRQLIYDVRANWKIILENYNECYHCGPAHPELCVLVPAFRDQGGAGLAWEDGIPHRAGAWTFTASGTSTRAPFPGLSETEKTHHKGEVVYPNLLLSAAAEHIAAFTLWPMGRGPHAHRLRIPVPRIEIAKPGFDPSDVVDFWDVVNRQDWRICEGVQLGMRSRGFRGGFYAPMEDPSLDIRRYLARHLGDDAGDSRD